MTTTGAPTNSIDKQLLTDGSWSELWDVVPNVVAGQTHRGLDFMERFGAFLKDRSLIEDEYAAKLRSLVKKSRTKMIDDETESKSYSYMSAFLAMLCELESLAGQHEVVAERFRKDFSPKLLEKCQELRSGRKRCLREFDVLKNNLNARVDDLVKQQKAYEKAFKQAQTAYLKYDKAENNMNITRIDLQNAKTNVHQNEQICEQSKQAYASQLQTTNGAKYEYYNKSLPQLLEQIRLLDIERIAFTKNVIQESLQAETEVLNIIRKCYDDMNVAIQTVNPDRDTLVVVEQGKSGYSHPEDFQFQDLGDPSSVLNGTTGGGGSSGGSTDHIDSTVSSATATLKRGAAMVNGVSGTCAPVNGKGLPRKTSMRIFGGGASGTNGSKGHGAGPPGGHGGQSGNDEYGHLPPQQRCRRIEQRISELQHDLQTKQHSLEGLERMHDVYSTNPRFGDVRNIKDELVQLRKHIDQLQVELSRYQNLLNHARSELNQPLGGSSSISSSSLGGVGRRSPCASPRIDNNNNQGGPIPGGGQYRNHCNNNKNNSNSRSSEARTSYSGDSVASSSNESTGVLVSTPHLLNETGNGGSSATTTSCSSSSIGVPVGGSRYPALNDHPSKKTNNSVASIHDASTPTSGLEKQPKFAGEEITNAGDSPNNVGLYEEFDDAPSNSADKKQQASSSPDGTTANGAEEQPLGSAIALYAYQGDDSNGGTTISMQEGDELMLLERDVGDGWTRVKHVSTDTEGFVPTTWIECTWF